MHVNACVMSAIMDATPSCAGVSAPWNACESICACPAAPKQVPLCPGLCAGQDFRLSGRLHHQGLVCCYQQPRRALPDHSDHAQYPQPWPTRPSADRWHDLHGCPTLRADVLRASATRQLRLIFACLRECLCAHSSCGKYGAQPGDPEGRPHCDST